MSAWFRRLMKRWGYYKIDYGFACGRHWMSIDGKVIAQTSGDDVCLRDEDVRTLACVVIEGCEWNKTLKGDGR